ncbi:MAG: hypothetical protein JJ902_20115 [Roseibium sp.]|nr:hypothetical protein [Roseibium sp.]
MAPIVIYGKAVQDARNRLRSAQISTMFDVLGAEMFENGGAGASAFAVAFTSWVEALPPLDENAGSQLDQNAAKSANRALSSAKVRGGDLYSDGTILDVFAIGDMLRLVGEYFEFGGGGADPTVTAVNVFRAGLRNQLAFNRANRARRPVQNFELTEHPDLGIFKLELLDRSTVKYMERYYGPYIGADISGTTTDALDVLAYYYVDMKNSAVSKAALQTDAASAIRLGREMVPISTMVLQYHHSLMECGLALSLASKSMSPANNETAAALARFNFYDYTTFTNNAERDPILPTLQRGNATLARDLAGRGLVVIRDVIDIDNNPYADAEIALLVENPSNNALFNINERYAAFSDKRQEVMLIENVFYENQDPSLAAIASGSFGGSTFANVAFNDLIKMNSVDLGNLKRTEAGQTVVFDNLDAALTAVRPQGAVMAAPAPVNPAPQAVSVTPPDPATMPPPTQTKAVAPSKDAATAANDLKQQIGKLDPKTIKALETLLSNR